MTSLLSCQCFPGVSSCQSMAVMLSCLLVFSWKLRRTAAASAPCNATNSRFGHPGAQKDQGYTRPSHSTGSSLYSHVCASVGRQRRLLWWWRVGMVMEAQCSPAALHLLQLRVVTPLASPDEAVLWGSARRREAGAVSSSVALSSAAGTTLSLLLCAAPFTGVTPGTHFCTCCNKISYNHILPCSTANMFVSNSFHLCANILLWWVLQRDKWNNVMLLYITPYLGGEKSCLYACVSVNPRHLTLQE